MIDIFLETGKKTTPEYRFVDDFVGKFLGVDPLEYKIECVDGKPSAGSEQVPRQYYIRNKESCRLRCR